jgi:hypothetical protein
MEVVLLPQMDRGSTRPRQSECLVAGVAALQELAQTPLEDLHLTFVDVSNSAAVITHPLPHPRLLRE